jgi:creatinine amidohydrolase/Fe(II)-dependent formamide hydrolase-like protein
VRVVQAWDVDISKILDAQPGPLHAGEAETSVMLHLYPELVRMDRARDYNLPEEEYHRYTRGEIAEPLMRGAGVVGSPTAATAEKGALIYECILAAIRAAVFLRVDEQTDTL